MPATSAYTVVAHHAAGRRAKRVSAIRNRAPRNRARQKWGELRKRGRADPVVGEIGFGRLVNERSVLVAGINLCLTLGCLNAGNDDSADDGQDDDHRQHLE